MRRRRSRKIKIADLFLGGDAPILIQSMTNTFTYDINSTVNQIQELEREGCELVRVAVPDEKSAKVLGKIKSKIRIPLIADIHFDWRLALEALNQGVDKLRINPGNITEPKKIKEIARFASRRNVPIRIGVNSGSISKEILNKYKNPNAEALAESALWEIKILEEEGFQDIIISLKSHDVIETVKAYQILAKKIDYPFHIGITEAGTLLNGAVRSAIGLGILLYHGIGDTIRVSLTASPLEEVKIAYEILKSLKLRNFGPTIISCPTCGRTEIDLISLALKVEKALKKVKSPIKVAVMGCSVNGPGEAREADLGIAGGKGVGLIFKKGKIIKKVKEGELFNSLMKEVENLI